MSNLRGKRGRCGRPSRTQLPIGRGWPGLEAALRLIWGWQGALEGKLAEVCPHSVALGGHPPDVAEPLLRLAELVELQAVAQPEGVHLDVSVATVSAWSWKCVATVSE